MSEWREQEWRIPRKGEIVKDQEGALGRVTKTEGTLHKRALWVEDVKGTEIYTGEPAEMFTTVDVATTNKFQNERHSLMGFKIGVLCSFKGDMNIPLEIVQMDWNSLRDKMIICLKDLREFDGEPMKTDDYTILEIFESDYPSADAIFSAHETGLKWRLNVSLIEKDPPSWTSCGSPWEFMKKEDALKEVSLWKARLKMRRVASVVNGSWKISFPAWVIEAIEKDGNILTRAKKVEASIGAPAYFKTSLHASLAMKLIPKNDINESLGFPQDDLIL